MYVCVYMISVHMLGKCVQVTETVKKKQGESMRQREEGEEKYASSQ